MPFPQTGQDGSLTFSLLDENYLPSVANLNPAMTINGITMEPDFVYRGIDASVASWPAFGYGQTLSQASSGTDGTPNAGSPLLGAADDSFKYNGGDVHQASNNTFGQVGTEDIVFEIVFSLNTNAAAEYIAGTWDSGVGWVFFMNANRTMSFYIYDASGAAQCVTTALTFDAWYHIICFIDRSGSGVHYVNAIAQAPAVFSARQGSITNANSFTIGSSAGLTGKSMANISYAAMWKRDAWLDTHLQATVAAERFARLTGIYPQKALGTRTATYTRPTIGYLDKYNATTGAKDLYLTGAGWPRWCYRKDRANVDFKGYFPETSGANKLLQSENFITSWSPVNGVLDTNNKWTDGDMEAAGTTLWAAGNSATLSKQGDPHSGTQCLRIARNGVNYPFAGANPAPSGGGKYRIRGWARGDGTAIPRIYIGTIAAFVWTGTTSTAWQEIDIVTDTSGGSINLYVNTTSGTTYAEYDDMTLEAYLPLDNFDNKLVDGNMETAGVAAWSAGNNATLTKETGTPHGGSQVLRVAYNGTTGPYAYQTILSANNTYLITGWARGNGSVAPYLYHSTPTVLLWQGSTSTSWQYFNINFTTTTQTKIYLWTVASGAGYCEFDDIQVSLLSTAPNKVVSTMSLVADTTATEHGVSQAATLTAASHVLSVFAKPGNKNWLYLKNETVANCDGYFDLATPALGTIGAGATGVIENYGAGWVRCGLVFTGTAALHTFRIQTADADTDANFAGDGSTINTYLWGAMVDTGNYAGFTSYVPATTATTTRSADLLYYQGDNGSLGGVGSNKIGTIACRIMTPLVAAYYRSAWSISDATTPTADVILCWRWTSDKMRVDTVSTGGSSGAVTGTTDAFNNYIHALRATYKNNGLYIYVDGVAEGTPDTVCDMPDELDRIYIGSYNANYQLGGLINNLKIYKVITQK